VIELMNPILRGWVNYFAIGDAGRCFGCKRSRGRTEKYLPDGIPGA
jgi:hypothetical protein